MCKPSMVSLLPVLLVVVSAVRLAHGDDASPSFVLHSSRGGVDQAMAVGHDVVIEAGGSPWYLTAIPTIDSSEHRQRETKFVWTIDGLPYVGQTVGPIHFDSCGEDGIGVELVELRKVEGTSWFDGRDIMKRVDCKESRHAEL